MGKLAFILGYYILRLFFKYRLHLSIKGLHNLPDSGGYVIAANQKSFIDIPLIFAALPLTAALNLSFLVSLRHKKKKWLTWLLGEKIIFVKNIIGISEAMHNITNALSRKKIVLIFPEGDWNMETEILPFYPGVGAISSISKALVIPTYIHNSGNALPEGSFYIRKEPVSIVFGQAMQAIQLRAVIKKSIQYRKFSEDLQKCILELRDGYLQGSSESGL